MLYETSTIPNLQIFAAQTVAYSLILLSDLLACLYTLLKIYRILCYSKITFDQLPLANPYTWPVAFFRIVTQPYFRFWARLLFKFLFTPAHQKSPSPLDGGAASAK